MDPWLVYQSLLGEGVVILLYSCCFASAFLFLRVALLRYLLCFAPFSHVYLLDAAHSSVH